MRNKIDYGILTAVPKEMTTYYEACEKKQSVKVGAAEYIIGSLSGKSVVMTPTGWGTVCASAVMTHLVENFKPEAIFFTGTAGGVASSLKQGDIVIGRDAFEIDLYNLIKACEGTPYAEGLVHSFKREMQPRRYLADKVLFESAKKIMPAFESKAMEHGKLVLAKVFEGTLATGNNFPLKPDNYKFLKQENALVYAMEGSAIYQTSWLFNVPSLVVRGISNLYADNGVISNVATSEVKIASDNAAKFIMRLLETL